MIRRGAEWGEPVAEPVSAREVSSDAELAAALSEGGGVAPLVRGGDVHRSLGSPSGSRATRRLPVDLIEVDADGWRLDAVAHVVARHRGVLGWWRGPIVAVMNVDHLGTWDVAPRAHPNDGWLDIVEVLPTMSRRARWQAARRLEAGTHVPHPDIAVRRAHEATFAFERALELWVDGVPRGPVAALNVRVRPDGGELFV